MTSRCCYSAITMTTAWVGEEASELCVKLDQIALRSKLLGRKKGSFHKMTPYRLLSCYSIHIGFQGNIFFHYVVYITKF